MANNLVRALRRLGACEEAREWATTYTDMPSAWAACERGDWMLWVAAKAGADRKLVVLAACACARLPLVYVAAGELRPLRAIETAEAWCRGEATIEQVREARSAAYASASAYAAAYAASAAVDYAAFGERSKTLRECADICRRMLPVPHLAGAMGEVVAHG